MTVAEYLADQLAGIGVKYLFGIPGGPSIPYLEAFRAAGIEFFLTSNEAAAGIMADVTARLTGISWCLPCHIWSGSNKYCHRYRRSPAGQVTGYRIDKRD